MRARAEGAEGVSRSIARSGVLWLRGREEGAASCARRKGLGLRGFWGRSRVGSRAGVPGAGGVATRVGRRRRPRVPQSAPPARLARTRREGGWKARRACDRPAPPTHLRARRVAPLRLPPSALRRPWPGLALEAAPSACAERREARPTGFGSAPLTVAGAAAGRGCGAVAPAPSSVLPSDGSARGRVCAGQRASLEACCGRAARRACWSLRRHSLRRACRRHQPRYMVVMDTCGASCQSGCWLDVTTATASSHSP